MRLDTKVVKEYFTVSPPNEKHPYPQSPILAVPKQIRRTLPACLAFLLLLFFFSGSIGGPDSRFFPSNKYPWFPKKIWQTWKVDPLGFEERDSSVAKTWIQKNPEYRYEVLTDQNDMAYVEMHFGPEALDRPDIVYMYRQLTTRIIKADLLRYMIMYVEGGIYTDIDVEALRPINKFIPERWDERDIDMIVGVEIDQPEFANHTILGQKCMSFVQWTFVCKPRLPVMMSLIEYILDWLRTVAAEQNVPVSEIKLDFDQVIVGTGPTAFTRAIMAEMEKRSGRSVTWDEFHSLQESKLIGGTLVLTVEAFAAGQGHSDSGTHEGKHSLIRHHYHASKWPTAHPRVKHPVYNEVEQCNWDWDCVQEWDRNVAEFETFPQEEKDRRIAEKEEQDRIREEEDRQREEEDRAREEQEAYENQLREDREAAERAYAEAERIAAEQAAILREQAVSEQAAQQRLSEQLRSASESQQQHGSPGSQQQQQQQQQQHSTSGSGASGSSHDSVAAMGDGSDGEYSQAPPSGADGESIRPPPGSQGYPPPPPLS